MADVHDKKTRSFNMSRIRGGDTKPEMLVRKFLFGKGLRAFFLAYPIVDAVRPQLAWTHYRLLLRVEQLEIL